MIKIKMILCPEHNNVEMIFMDRRNNYYIFYCDNCKKYWEIKKLTKF